MRKTGSIAVAIIATLIFLPELIVIAPFLLYMHFTGKLVKCST